MEMIGPLSSNRNVDESCSSKPLMIIPVAPLDLTEKIYNDVLFKLLFCIFSLNIRCTWKLLSSKNMFVTPLSGSNFTWSSSKQETDILTVHGINIRKVFVKCRSLFYHK